MRRTSSTAVGRIAASLARGFAMGAVDVVPGVSGGTAAMAMGIYERLLASMKAAVAALTALARGDRRSARERVRGVEWTLVAPLAAGVVCAVVLLSPIIEAQLADHPSEMAGLFCGLVAASIATACRLFEWRRAGLLALTAAVAAVTFAALGAQAAPVAAPPLLALFGAGAVASCAMILPGISGAFVLLMMGMYAAVINVISERLLADAAVIAAGVGVGLALFSTVLGGLLERARNAVMATMSGLMAGSFRVLWPWPDGVGVISRHETAVSGTDLAWPQGGEWLAPTAAAAVGFIIVLSVNRLSDLHKDGQHNME